MNQHLKKVRIIFKTKYACEKDWSDGKCNQALYEKDKAALVDWKRSHKIIRYLLPLVETALVLTAIWFFGFHALPSIFHRYYDAGDFDMGFRSSFMAVICFLGILPFAMKLLGMLLRKLKLKGPAVTEPPCWRDLELKYERYALIQSLLTSEENTPIAIAAAASFGFRSVRNQDMQLPYSGTLVCQDKQQAAPARHRLVKPYPGQLFLREKVGVVRGGTRRSGGREAR